MTTSPTIHLNGSDGEQLFADLASASSALRAAEIALNACAPNARDYYPQGPGAFERARAEHTARLKTLFEMRAEIEALAENVDRQLEARKRR